MYEQPTFLSDRRYSWDFIDQHPRGGDTWVCCVRARVLYVCSMLESPAPVWCDECSRTPVRASHVPCVHRIHMPSGTFLSAEPFPHVQKGLFSSRSQAEQVLVGILSHPLEPSHTQSYPWSSWYAGLVFQLDVHVVDRLSIASIVCRGAFRYIQCPSFIYGVCVCVCMCVCISVCVCV